MKTILPLLAALVTLLFCGCSANKHYVVAATSTIIGLEIAQNPSTQMYQAKLGYNRAEAALIPSNRGTGKKGDPTTGAGAKDTTDVVMELRYANIFSLSSSGIYQRLAVGSGAVGQPGAAFMFGKDGNGTLDPAVAAQISSSIKGIPAPSPALTALKMPLAKAFQTAQDKSKFESAAKANGYASFSDFLIEVNTPAEKVNAVTTSVQNAP